MIDQPQTVPVELLFRERGERSDTGEEESQLGVDGTFLKDNFLHQ